MIGPAPQDRAPLSGSNTRADETLANSLALMGGNGLLPALHPSGECPV